MTTAVASQTNYKSVLKWGILSAVAALNGYVCVLMYSRGETAFAMLTLVLTALAVYVFGSKKNYAHRYTYPGIAGMILFIIFPLVYTVGLAFTNYSATNQVTLERAQAVHLTKTYQSGKSYSFQLMNQGNGYALTIKDSGQLFATETFNLAEAVERKLELAPVDSVKGKKATIKQIIAKRPNLNLITLSLPSGEEIQMSGLRKFAAVGPLFVMQEDGETLYNNKTETYFKANHDTGFYQEVDDNDVFVGDPISPGFIVNVGGANFERIWKDDGIKEPFISIFIWTVIFATCTVVFTLAIGLVLAAVV